MEISDIWTKISKDFILLEKNSFLGYFSTCMILNVKNSIKTISKARHREVLRHYVHFITSLWFLLDLVEENQTLLILQRTTTKKKNSNVPVKPTENRKSFHVSSPFEVQQRFYTHSKETWNVSGTNSTNFLSLLLHYSNQ